jgi:hypothetical protein
VIYSLLALLDFTASISYESIRGPWLWHDCVSHGWDFPGCIPWCHRNAELLGTPWRPEKKECSASGKFGKFYPKSPLAHRLIIFTPKNTILGSMYFIYIYVYILFICICIINIYIYVQPAGRTAVLQPSQPVLRPLTPPFRRRFRSRYLAWRPTNNGALPRNR